MKYALFLYGINFSSFKKIETSWSKLSLSIINKYLNESRVEDDLLCKVD